MKMNFDVANLDRSTPPKVLKSRDVKFPAYYEERLSNGIKVFVVEDNKIPLITVKFVLKAGAYEDLTFGEDKSGLASLTSDLLVKGTEKMNAVQVAETIDFYGATISSGCDYDASYLALTSLKKYFNKLFDIASELITEPAYIEDEIVREKQQITNSLLSYLDEGSYLSERVFKKNVYKNSPYKLNVEGKINSVEKLERELIKEFFKKYFIPENLIITVIGDIKSADAVSLIKSKFSNWKNPGKIIHKKYEEQLNNCVKIFAAEKKGAVQSDIMVGHIGTDRKNPDYIKMNVMNTLLGGFFTSRINKNLREVNGYTYGARSYFSFRKNLGDFYVETNVENSLTYNAIKEIMNELKILKSEKITEDELESVKNYLTGSFPLQLETPNAIANKIINLELYEIQKDFYDTFISKINSVTIDDVKEIAEKYIHPDNLVISVAGNVNVIRQTMEQIAEVEVINNINEL
jgi:zinc protease